VARQQANKLTASECDQATRRLARTWIAFTTQRLTSDSVAVHYPAAQEVAEALGL
jgi:hypothetical protein|tara:strand:+ start:573 stop:737 length:165 start_codon:yes stop_codon:yes gene_type:complete